MERKINSNNFKLEISNICFYSYSQKKKYLFQQLFKKKLLELFIKKRNKENFSWDSERKLFSTRSSNKKNEYKLNIASRHYFYPEIIFLIKDLGLKTHHKLNVLFKISNRNFFLNRVAFSDIIVYVYLDSSNFIPHRFGLYNVGLIKPTFNCFPSQEQMYEVSNILNLGNYHSFSFPISLTILIFRLKPGTLKLVINGTSGLLFFSVSYGFNAFCPVFIKKKKKKKRTNLNFFFFFSI